MKDQLIAQVTEMISTEVVKAAIMKLVSMLNPAGAVVQAIIAIYNTVTFFVEKINQIAAVVASFIDSIAAIAAGQVANAAKKVEQTMANTLVVVIAFLAKFAGLGNIPSKLVGIVKKIRQPIDKGLDKIVAWLGKVLEKAKALFGKKDKDKDGVSSAVIKEPFSMGSASHTLTATLKGEVILLTMASNQDIALSLQLGSAISLIEDEKEVDDKGQPIKREPSQKSAILSHLKPVKQQVDNLRSEYVQSGRPEAFDKFIKPRLAASIGQLSRLAKYKPAITSLKPLISIGKPRYIPKRWDIRKNLYDATTGGGWAALSNSMRTNHIEKTLRPKLFKIWQLRDDKSSSSNYAKAEAQWNAMQSAREIPSVKKAPSFKNYHHPTQFDQLKYETDHTISLGTSWNAGEKNKDDATRKATTLDTSNLRVITKEENQERSKNKSINPNFDRDVGPDFSSVVAHSPKGSMIIDGKPFDDKP